MIPTFWKWFLGFGGARPGVMLILGWPTLIHASIAASLTFLLKSDGFDFALKALFPAASIFVGMSIAWTFRAATVLNDKGFRKKVINENNPIEEYLYGFQLSILILMFTVAYISLMAAGGFNFYIISVYWSIKLSSFWLYFLISMSVRECWSIVNFTNLLSILADFVDDKSDMPK